MMKRSLSRQHHRQQSSAFGFESLEQRRMLTVIDLFPSQDTTLYENLVNESANGAGVGMVVGNTNKGLTRRGLIKFDIAAAIPRDSSINDATLTLHVDKTVAGPVEISLHPVLNDWGEGTSAVPAEGGGVGAATTPDSATWNFRSFPAERWDTAGGDFSNVALASSVVNEVGQYNFTSFRMSDQITDWLVSPETNFGWMLIGDESTRKTTKRFGTRESEIQPVLTIDYDPPDFPQLSIAGTSGVEGDADHQSFQFAVTVSKEFEEAITVNYEAVSNTAIADEDFDPTAGQLIFNPGEPLTQEITVLVRGDRQNEVDESFSVVLSGPEDNYDILTRTAVATIENDDPLPSVVTESIRVIEGNEGFTDAELTFTLSEASGREVSLQYIGRGETANLNTDYIRGTGQVTFAPGETTKTAIINVIGDTEEEPDETISVVLANARNVELEVPSIQVTIVDDDAEILTPWQNAVLPVDVTNDGVVSPLDALLIINELNNSGSRLLSPPAEDLAPPPFIDVNGDNFVAPLDALLVINHLNNPPAVAAVQAIFATEPTSSITAAHAAAALADIDDHDAEEKRRRLGKAIGNA